jgi:RNA recognition motif-containing protein
MDEEPKKEESNKNAGKKRTMETETPNAKRQRTEANGEAKNYYSVFVGNLSYETTEEGLQKHFKSCGKLLNVRVIRQKSTGESRG